MTQLSQRGKKYRQAVEAIEPDRQYAPQEGVELVKRVSTSTFDGTVELHMRLGVDPRHADQVVRGVAILPHGTGKRPRIIAFAQGDKAREAEEAGADEVGGEELAKRIQDGWLEFDVAVATPDMMGVVGRLGRVLGPRGLMPNPRTGTVTADIGRAIDEIRQGRVEFRVDRTGIIHVPIGKVSFEPQQLLDNLGTMVDAIVRARPSGARGTYVRSIALSPTMGPGVALDTAATTALEAH
ncbi:MAG TPA: 50S ribosomal protein L1 [Chloroflexota bacterium]|nr:50S ribosomal protein L1 [Chloroflexota bacterium]